MRNQPKTLFEYYNIPDNYERQERAAIQEFDGGLSHEAVQQPDEQEWQSLIASEPAITKNTSRTKENDEMIKVERSNTPTGSSTPRGVQFLSPKHVTSPEGFNATIYKVTTDKKDNYGNPYVVYFDANGEKFSKGFKPTSDLLISLVDMFGDDEKVWIGQRLNINSREDEGGGLRLVFAKIAAPKAKK